MAPSGVAGGLIATWAHPHELVNVSFPEHIRLAELHNSAERWGWRYVKCGNWKGCGEENPPPADAGMGDSEAEQRREKGLPDGIR